MFVYRLKNFIRALLAIAFSLLVALCVRAANVSRLSSIEGKRTFFLDSASSQGLQKEALSLGELSRVKGECVSFALDEYKGGRYASSEQLAETLAREFDAEILIKEEACGVTSYYCHTALWQDEIFVEGQAINLHIAIGEKNCVVGAPIIFGGY